MGYYVESEISNFLITDPKGALKAINELHTSQGMDNNNPGGGSWRGGVQTSRHYSWVTNPPEGGFKNLQDALEAWNFSFKDDGETIEIDYDQCEKWGDQETFYNTIAPFVHEDAEVYCTGEEDDVWKYTFEDGVCHEIQGKKEVEWEDEEEKELSRLDLKEGIAFDIFDFDGGEDYVRPSEEDCHKIAEIILNRINAVK